MTVINSFRNKKIMIASLINLLKSSKMRLLGNPFINNKRKKQRKVKMMIVWQVDSLNRSTNQQRKVRKLLKCH